MNNEFLQTEEAIVAMLKTVYDPEIPVNVYDLGLIYKVDIDEEKNVRIDMTLTAPKPRLRAGMGQGHDDGGG